MVVAVTEGVKISVFSLFEERMSAAPQGSFVFSYRISIENQNDFPVQLLRRHWFITDSNGLKREIEGPGVVGEQPVIAPGENFSYTSACDLQSPFGLMKGFYSMQMKGATSLFKVQVPEFSLEADFMKN
jgi:ApaG protein